MLRQQNVAIVLLTLAVLVLCVSLLIIKVVQTRTLIRIRPIGHGLLVVLSGLGHLINYIRISSSLD